MQVKLETQHGWYGDAGPILSTVHAERTDDNEVGLRIAPAFGDAAETVWLHLDAVTAAVLGQQLLSASSESLRKQGSPLLKDPSA